MDMRQILRAGVGLLVAHKETKVVGVRRLLINKLNHPFSEKGAAICPVGESFCQILIICLKTDKRTLPAIRQEVHNHDELFSPFAVLIWSVNAIVSKLSAGAIDPAAISFYRWLLALLALTPFVLPAVWRNRREVAKALWKLLVLGLLGMVLYQCLTYYAAHSVTALFMGILNALIRC